MAKQTISDFILSLGFDGSAVNKGLDGVEKRLNKLGKSQVKTAAKTKRAEENINKTRKKGAKTPHKSAMTDEKKLSLRKARYKLQDTMAKAQALGVKRNHYHMKAATGGVKDVTKIKGYQLTLERQIKAATDSKVAAEVRATAEANKQLHLQNQLSASKTKLQAYGKKNFQQAITKLTPQLSGKSAKSSASAFKEQFAGREKLKDFSDKNFQQAIAKLTPKLSGNSARNSASAFRNMPEDSHRKALRYRTALREGRRNINKSRAVTAARAASASLNKLANKSKLASTKVGRLGRKSSGAANASSHLTRNLLGAAAGLGLLLRMTSSLTNAMRQQIEYEKAKVGVEGVGRALSAGVAGDAMKGQNDKVFVKDQVAFLDNMVNTFAVDLPAATATWRSVLGASIQQLSDGSVKMKDLKDLMMGVSAGASAFKMSSEDQKGMWLGITQIMQKGKVQAEELTRQIGQRNPLAIQAMLKAVEKWAKMSGKLSKDAKFTHEQMYKMMRNGDILAKDVMPEWGRQMKKLADSMVGLDPLATADETAKAYFKNMNKSLGGSIQVIDAKMSLFWKDVFSDDSFSGFKTVTKSIQGLLKESKWVSDQLGAVFGDIGAMVGASINKNVLPYFKKMQKEYKSIISDPKKIKERELAIAMTIKNIGDVISAFFDGLMAGFKGMWAGLKTLSTWVKSIASFLGFDTGSIDNKALIQTFAYVMGIASAIAILGGAVSGIMLFLTPFTAAFGLLATVLGWIASAIAVVAGLLSATVLLIVAAVALIAYEVWYYWDDIKRLWSEGSAWLVGSWEKFVSDFINLWNSVIKPLNTFADSVVSVFANLFSKIYDLLPKWAQTSIDKVGEVLGGDSAEIKEHLITTFTPIAVPPAFRDYSKDAQTQFNYQQQAPQSPEINVKVELDSAPLHAIVDKKINENEQTQNEEGM